MILQCKKGVYGMGLFYSVLSVVFISPLVSFSLLPNSSGFLFAAFQSSSALGLHWLFTSQKRQKASELLGIEAFKINFTSDLICLNFSSVMMAWSILGGGGNQVRC